MPLCEKSRQTYHVFERYRRTHYAGPRSKLLVRSRTGCRQTAKRLMSARDLRRAFPGSRHCRRPYGRSKSLQNQKQNGNNLGMAGLAVPVSPFAGAHLRLRDGQAAFIALQISSTRMAAEIEPGSGWPKERSPRRAARPTVATMLRVASAPCRAAAIMASVF